MSQTSIELSWILPALFVVSALYGAVGHGGASGYLAVMSLAAIAPATVRPTALVLNAAVSLLGTMLFLRRGHFHARLFVPFSLFSVPFAYAGGMMKIPALVFHLLLAGALMLAAARLLFPDEKGELREAPAWAIACAGSAIGMLSGLIGVGGGIFLTPLLIFCRWSDAKTAAAVSAPFILVNSLAGLAGLGSTILSSIALEWPLMLVAVLSGGLIGALWGSGAATARALKFALSLVLVVAAGKVMLSI